jgi:hypothetical protein
VEGFCDINDIAVSLALPSPGVSRALVIDLDATRAAPPDLIGRPRRHSTYAVIKLPGTRAHEEYLRRPLHDISDDGALWIC